MIETNFKKHQNGLQIIGDNCCFELQLGIYNFKKTCFFVGEDMFDFF